MKKFFCVTLLGIFIAAFNLNAQPATPSNPHFGGGMNKLFGEQQSFSATLEWQTTDPRKGDTVTIPGKITVDSGKSRFEMDMTQMKPNKISPTEAAQMKQFGMEKIVMIDRPDKKVGYMVYDGLQSYVENSMTDPEMIASPNDFKIETTELGKETVDGHPCVKNKTVVIDKQSNTNEFTTWNATDLKNFPVKLQSSDMTMSFKDISFAKPDANLFEPPAAYTKYDSMMAMMRDQIMKQMGGGAGFNPFGR